MTFFTFLFKVMFKVIPYLYPFVKEMLIGKKTWRQAFRENRGKTILAITMIVSVTFNIVLSAKIGHLAYQYLELSRAKEELELKYVALSKSKGPVESSAKHPIVNNVEQASQEKEPKPAPVKAVPKPIDPTNEVSAEFERIRQREEAAEGLLNKTRKTP